MPSTPPSDFALSAWIDESVIVGKDGAPGTYTMAAVVTDQTNAGDVRDALLELTVRRAVRLHWVAESPKRRDLIAQAISRMDVAAIVAIGFPMNRSKQERARRCCLERLLFELCHFGVSQVWMESRMAVQDRRDLALIDSARDKGLISNGLVVNFARPTWEPMLWLPDAVAGAVTASLLGEPRWLLAVSEIVTVHQVTIR